MNRTMPSLSDRLDLAIEEECAEIRNHPTSPDLQLCRRNQSWIVADLLIAGRDHAAAAKAACEMADECEAHWQACYDAACLLARCVSLVRNDESLSGVERSKLHRSYASKAVRFVKSALHKGFDDLERLSSDPDLDPLRDYGGFNELIVRFRIRLKGSKQ